MRKILIVIGGVVNAMQKGVLLQKSCIVLHFFRVMEVIQVIINSINERFHEKRYLFKSCIISYC